jgi:uncharacterized membrane protein YhaH (DUF805 family)
MTGTASFRHQWFQGRLSALAYRREKGRRAFLIGGLATVSLLAGQAISASPALLVVIAVCASAGATLLVALLNVPLDVRRAHDLGLSGWWLVIGYAAIYAALYALLYPPNDAAVAAAAVALLSFIAGGALFGVLLGWLRGQVGPNAYGEPPPSEAVTALFVDSRWIKRLIELSFEPYGDGFVFYKNAWSSGIPVTAEEREAYLSAEPFAWSAIRKGFEGRRPLTPPQELRTVLDRLRVYPTFMMLPVLVFAWIALRFASAIQEPLLRVPIIFFGVIGLGLSLITFVAKLLPARR